MTTTQIDDSGIVNHTKIFRHVTAAKHRDEVNEINHSDNLSSMNIHTTDNPINIMFDDDVNSHIRKAFSSPRPPNLSNKKAWNRITLLIVGDSTCMKSKKVE